MDNYFRISLAAIVFFLPLWAFCQESVNISGTIIDAQSGEPLEAVTVAYGDQSTLTGATGEFALEVVPGEQSEIVFSKEGFEEMIVELPSPKNGQIMLGQQLMRLSVRAEEEEVSAIPTVVLSDSELETEDAESQDISGILSASNDVFVQTASYNLSSARFDIRGYDSENTTLLMNGIQMNDPENGRVFWSIWGGLNDVMRSRDISTGLAHSEFAFGGVGGSTYLNVRPSSQRKQLRVSLAESNRSYRHRLMATWSSGWLPGDWAITLSGSRRWGDEGYVKGTFYDAWSYFVGVEKKLNENHSLSLVGFGAPSERGRNGASVQEIYDLLDDNYYNPYWGYQNGEVRNSRIYRSHRPTGILTHDWTPNDDITLETSIAFQSGKYGTTALDWNNARDPRPDYYRYLPSWQTDPELEEEVREAWLNNEDVRHIDWEELYNVNYNSDFTVLNANGIAGNTVTGRRAKYIVEERRYDPTVATFSTNYKHLLSSKVDLQAGLSYQHSRYDNYKLVDDLLGGEYLLDIDKYAERDFVGYQQDIVQTDLRNPIRVVGEGDEFGYNYELHQRQGQFWAQTFLHLKKFDIFGGASVMQTSFWRDGQYQNGLFPDNSLGESEKEEYTTYGLKAGATYKITGRHFLYANGMIGTRPPFMRNSFLSPRVNNRLNPYNTEENMTSVEAGYQIKSPFVKGRATVYRTTFEDRTDIIAFYNDIERTFGYFVLSNLDYLHQGVELAAEVTLSPTVSVSGVAALGDYHLTSRPLAATIDDRREEFIFEDETIYAKNFYKSGTPLTAGSIELSYNSPDYWFANLSFSYFDDIFIDFNPNRRRAEAVALIPYGSDQWNAIVDQEKVDSGYSLDFFGGKSWKIDDVFLYLNVGVSNILNDKDLITGGYEQLRFDGQDRDPEAFPAEYYYRYGMTYYINLSVRI